jgi:hypothetical protein
MNPQALGQGEALSDMRANVKIKDLTPLIKGGRSEK